MAAQGSYPLNGRIPVGTDTATGVVTAATADIPLSDIAGLFFDFPQEPNTVLAGPASGAVPAPSTFRQLVPLDLPIATVVDVGAVKPDDETITIDPDGTLHSVPDGVQAITAGEGISIDDTDPANPIISNTGVLAVVAGDGIVVDDTDPFNPIVTATTTALLESVVAGDGIIVDDTDPANPVVSNAGVIALIAGDNITIDGTDPQNPIINASGSGVIESVTGAPTDAVDNTDPANPIVTALPISGGTLTGPIVLPNGAAATPALQFGTGAYGFYRNTDTLVAAFNGVNTYSFSATGVALTSAATLRWGSSGITATDVGISRGGARVLNADATAGFAFNGQILAATGTGTAPGMAFAAFPGTGFSASSIALAWNVNSVNRVVLTTVALRPAATNVLDLGSSGQKFATIYGTALSLSASVSLAAPTTGLLTVTAPSGVNMSGPIKPQTYTVATVPAAASFTGYMIYVSDATGGAAIAFSNGTDWVSTITGIAI